MKIAYLILAHDQPSLFSRLVNALSHPSTHFFAHIDGKFDVQPFRDATQEDVVFVDERIKVSWGGFSQVEAMLQLLQSAYKEGEFDYYIFLSGRDYPIKSNHEIMQFLEQSQGKSYINFYQLADGVDLVKNIKQYCYYDLYAKLPTKFLQKAAKRIVRSANRVLPDRKFVTGMTPYRGSTSWCLSAEIIEYILNFINAEKNKKYIDFFYSVSCSDEIFFQSIVLNSPLAKTCQNYEEDIIQRGERTMQNENKVSLHYIDWNPVREDPAVFDRNDMSLLMASEKLFARKFDIVKSANLLDEIDLVRAKVDHA